jgi:hypothetical protein
MIQYPGVMVGIRYAVDHLFELAKKADKAFGLTVAIVRILIFQFMDLLSQYRAVRDYLPDEIAFLFHGRKDKVVLYLYRCRKGGRMENFS